MSNNETKNGQKHCKNIFFVVLFYDSDMTVIGITILDLLRCNDAYSEMFILEICDMFS